ncbi:hypothetical protein PINS_up010170 [Pythium insidiosum]|nr:hypothetical protein PINS_up010170 [Pythium insidiosum]
MGVYIDNEGFGAYVGMLRRLAKRETRELHELQEEFNKGIAERVFEISKKQFSAENRQQALNELLARTQAAGSTEVASTASKKNSDRASSGSHASLASLSLDILNRVTSIDVYLDNVLRRKSGDPQYSNRLAAQPIAELDLKIRAQLSRFLAATQKSRHHSRIKVVTWVLCGMLAKIHAVLQLDDKLPDEVEDAQGSTQTQRSVTPATALKKEVKDDDDAEECDCCCVGLETCACKCTCSCHRDDSDESDGGEDDDEKEVEENDAEDDDDEDDQQKRPAKNDAAEMRHAAETELMQFVAARLALLAPNERITSSQAIAMLASADQHIREEMAAAAPSFSVLDAIAGVLKHSSDKQDIVPSRLSTHPGMQRLFTALRSDEDGHASTDDAPDIEMQSEDEKEASSDSVSRVSTVSDEDLDHFFKSCLHSLSRSTSEMPDAHEKIIDRLVVAPKLSTVWLRRV